jgi:hypothetical protein
MTEEPPATENLRRNPSPYSFGLSVRQVRLSSDRYIQQIENPGDSMKRIAFSFCIAIWALASVPAFANCVGSPTFQTCADQNGNTYSVNRLGNTTTVNGYNGQAGSSWNETATTIGNNTTINGNAANGQHWNENINSYGNGNRTISGVDSNGNAFSKTCTPYGCN